MLATAACTASPIASSDMREFQLREDGTWWLGLNEAGDTEVAAAGNANGRSGKRAAKSEDGATKQRREAGVEEDQDSSKHKTSAFAILSVDDDLNESAASIELKRQQAFVMDSE